MRTSPFFLLAVACVFSVGIFALSVRLWEVQVKEVASAREDLVKQATRRVRVPGLRGRILDAKGRTLAASRPNRCLTCRVEMFQRVGNLSNTVNAVEEAIARLAKIVRRPVPFARERIVRHVRTESARPLIVFPDLSDDDLARFYERAQACPGFVVETRAERQYAYGPLAAHAIGYVGRDRVEAVDQDEHAHFVEQEMKGRIGLEGFYDRFLAGAPGAFTVRVDARGFLPKRPDFDVKETETEAADGLDLESTIDAELQRVLEQSLKGVCGAGVVLNPNSGAVLAIASSPSFDLNRCVPRLSPEYYATLTNDAQRPLLNRAVSGLYAPGSIFKPVTSCAALREKREGRFKNWTPQTPISNCCGVFHMSGLSLHCWDIYGHGRIGLEDALKYSCNVYFAELGREIGTNALFSMARLFGLGSRTGIDIPGESAGGIWRPPWQPGDLPQTSIGQGKLLVTPLQMAVVCAAIANRGRVYRPYLHARAADLPPPDPVRVLPLAREDLEVVRRGMRAVVEMGTGRRIRTNYCDDGRSKYVLNVPCAGKTGTAEVGRGATRHKNTWIIAFAPYDEPTVAIAMVVERGVSGGHTVAPRVHQVLASVFGETRRNGW